jgi:hypothetical protein
LLEGRLLGDKVRGDLVEAVQTSKERENETERRRERKEEEEERTKGGGGGGSVGKDGVEAPNALIDVILVGCASSSAVRADWLEGGREGRRTTGRWSGGGG